MSKLKFIENKIVQTNQVNALVSNWRLKSNTIVFTNGVFDLLHRGHIEYLMAAADYGNKLIVGLNSDISAKMLGKGPTRPLQDEHTRALILAAITYVDAVVLFNEETPENLITQIKPDVLVKGGDYQIEQIAGNKFVLKNGGKVFTIPLTRGYSTTSIENKIKQELDGKN